MFLNLPLTTIKTRNKLNKLRVKSKKLLRQDGKVFKNLEDDDQFSFINYMYKYGNYPIYDNSKATYFPDGKLFLDDLLIELKKAKKTIFLEFFIIEKGVMWDQILEILKSKVNEKVEVRVLYDGMCSLCLLPSYYPKKLEKMGIKCKVYSPIKNIISTYQNHRDHRKICIIDGNVLYTGGINIGDNYIHVKNDYGYWKDAAVKLTGESVKTYLCTFLEMWNLTEKDNENFSKYFSNYSTTKKESGYILPFVDQPFSKERITKNTYLNVINTATKYIHIITPYLVLDTELLNQFIYAAKRGIEIQIIMPNIPDKKSVYYLGRSYYQELIESGIEIYEYLPGFTHAKVVVSDSNKAVVGSTNLDYRSLYLQYESNIYFYKNDIVSDIENDFQKTKSECKKITISELKGTSLIKKIIGKILRLFAPLL